MALDPGPLRAEQRHSAPLTDIPTSLKARSKAGSPGRRDARDKGDRSEPQLRVKLKTQAGVGRLRNIHPICYQDLGVLSFSGPTCLNCETGVMVPL